MSSIELRPAKPADVDAMMLIKQQLPLKRADGSMSTGGFLLGTTSAQYLHHVLNDHCLVAESDHGVIGFGIMLHDNSLRSSDIWLKRHQASWNIAIDTFEPLAMCYFEQLAFLPGYSRAVLKLAYNLVQHAFDSGHEAMFTTTVHQPVVNLAAVPYIRKAGGAIVGKIDEYYPNVGDIVSDIYLIERSIYQQEVPQLDIYPWLRSHLLSERNYY